MPTYGYRCGTCGKEVDRYVDYEGRETPWPCDTYGCYGEQRYTFPVTAARGFQPFAEYHDEALGVDITGRRQKRQTLAAMGLQEAGDKVGGARFEEHSSHAARIVPLPPQGVSLSELQRRSDLDRAAAAEMVVGVDGRDKVRVSDLPAPKASKPLDVVAIAKKAAAQISAMKE